MFGLHQSGHVQGPDYPFFPSDRQGFPKNRHGFVNIRQILRRRMMSGYGTIPVADPERDQTANKPEQRKQSGPVPSPDSPFFPGDRHGFPENRHGFG
jgi:hypothetical protein